MKTKETKKSAKKANGNQMVTKNPQQKISDLLARVKESIEKSGLDELRVNRHDRNPIYPYDVSVGIDGPAIALFSSHREAKHFVTVHNAMLAALRIMRSFKK